MIASLVHINKSKQWFVKIISRAYETFTVCFLQGFPISFNQPSEIHFGLCNPVTFYHTKSLKSVDLSPLFFYDRKVFTAKGKANIDNFCLHDEFSAIVIDPVASGKWRLAKTLSWVEILTRRFILHANPMETEKQVHKIYP